MLTLLPPVARAMPQADNSATTHRKARTGKANGKKRKIMELEKNDYREIASRIEDGANSVEYVKDGESLFIDCTFERGGYCEDDRENGTGAWIETWRQLIVSCAEICDSDGNISPFYVDEGLLERLVS